MDFWKPDYWPKFNAWIPSEPDQRSEVNFWKTSSDPRGSFPLPGSVEEDNPLLLPLGRRTEEPPLLPPPGGRTVPREIKFTFWKPAYFPQKKRKREQSNWQPSPGSEDGVSVLKWTPSSESDEVSGLWKWKPSSQPQGGSSDWKWTLVDKAHGTWKFAPSDQVHGIFGQKPSPLTPLPIPPVNPDWEPSSLPLPKPPEPDRILNNFVGICLPTTNDMMEMCIDKCIRRHRLRDAKLFNDGYNFVHGMKFSITPRGMDSWSDDCYDAPWVAFLGTDSMCVVTRRKDLDMRRVGSFFQRCCSNRQTLSKLVESVISEVECLAVERKGKPLGVVSLTPVDAESELEDLSAAEKSIEFLKEKLMMKRPSSSLVFTFDETIQTAISAFQHLCPETKLKAIDIWVTACNEKRTEHLHLKQIKEHLDVIRGVSRGGVSSSSSTVVSHGGSCSTSDSDSERPVTWSGIMEEIAVACKRLPCSCGSKVCGGDGFKPCETGLMWDIWLHAMHL